MDFIEYRSIVEEKLRRKNINSGINLDSLFDSYINNTDPSTYVKNYLGVLSEKTNMDKRFNRYLSEIISMVRKYGYNIIKMPKELNEICLTVLADFDVTCTTPISCVRAAAICAILR